MWNQIHLDHYSVGIPFILTVIATILSLQTIVRKMIGVENLQKAHEVGGYYLSLVGTFYAVLLGLVVFDAMSKFQEAEKTVEAEARSILTVYALADQFPNQTFAIKSLVKSYLDEVVTNELQLMEDGNISEKARNIVLATVRVVKAIKPNDNNQQGVFPVLLQETINWWEKRRDRTRTSMFGIPPAEWVVLIAGAIITIIFTFFFTSESRGIQLLMKALWSLLLSMSLYLVLLFGSPFSGDLKVSSQPFEFVRKAIGAAL
jgi:hypothetical protein